MEQRPFIAADGPLRYHDVVSVSQSRATSVLNVIVPALSAETCTGLDRRRKRFVTPVPGRKREGRRSREEQ